MDLQFVSGILIRTRGLSVNFACVLLEKCLMIDGSGSAKEQFKKMNIFCSNTSEALPLSPPFSVYPRGISE